MDTTLEKWIEREAEILAANKRGCGSGFCTPAQLDGKTGLQIIEGMMNGSLPAPYSARHEAIVTVEAERGRVVFQGRPAIQHLNPAGTVHGGWMANLMDSAMGTAVLSLLRENKSTYVTARMEVIYHLSMAYAVGRVRCTAIVDERVEKGARVVCTIADVDGRIYAEATGYYKVGRGAWA